jgi:hypothetical protein
MKPLEVFGRQVCRCVDPLLEPNKRINLEKESRRAERVESAQGCRDFWGGAAAVRWQLLPEGDMTKVVGMSAGSTAGTLLRRSHSAISSSRSAAARCPGFAIRITTRDCGSR